MSVKFQELPYQASDTSQAWHVGSRPFLHNLDVLGAKVDHADALQAITSSTSDLLAITFKALGNGVMDNVADIRFVYTHTEGYRSNDDDVIGDHEPFLHCNPCTIRHSGVISAGIESGEFQTSCYSIRLLHESQIHCTQNKDFPHTSCV